MELHERFSFSRLLYLFNTYFIIPIHLYHINDTFLQLRFYFQMYRSLQYGVGWKGDFRAARTLRLEKMKNNEHAEEGTFRIVIPKY